MEPRSKQNFDILQVDFQWVEKTNNAKLLKQALKALQDEGGYVELEKAVQDKLALVSPSSILPDNNISASERRQIEEDIEQWIFQVEEQKQDQKQMKLMRIQAEEEKTKGNDYLRAGDLNMALQCYDKAAGIDPSNAAIFCNRALVHLKKKAYSRVISDCEIAIKLNPDYVKAYHRRGKARFCLNDFKGALTDFEIVLKHEPSNSEVNKDLMECRKKVSENSDFKRVCIVEEDDESDEEENQQEESQGEKDPDSLVRQILHSVQFFKEEGTKLYQKGSYQDAIDLYEKGVEELEKLKPREKQEVMDSMAALFNNIALCAIQQSDYSKVIQATSSALNCQSTDVNVVIKAFLRRALAKEQQEQYKQAQQDFLKVKELNPDNLQASQGLQRISTFIIQENQKEIIKLSIETDNLYSQLDELKQRGNKSFQSKDFKDSAELFQLAIQNYLKFQEKHNLTVMEERFRTLLVQLYTNCALANLQLDANSLAMYYSKEALALEPDNIKALFRLGKAQTNCNQFQEAMKNFKRVFELDPNNATIRQEIQALNKKIQDQNAAAEQQSQKQKQKKSVRFAEQKPSKGIRFADSTEDIESKEVSNNIRFADADESKQDNVITFTEEEEVKFTPQARVKVDQNVVNNAKQKAFQALGEFDIPKTAFSFEQNLKELKGKPQQLTEYIQKVRAETLQVLYTQTQMEPELFIDLMQIGNSNEIDKEIWREIITALPQIRQFESVLKFLMGSERRMIKSLIQKLEYTEAEEQELMSRYRV